MFANCLKNNYVNSLYAVYVLALILHVRYGNHRKMLGLTCLIKLEVTITRKVLPHPQGIKTARAIC
jgi:hypothetical protein